MLSRRDASGVARESGATWATAFVPTRQIGGDARRPKGVVADLGRDLGRLRAPLDHRIGVRLGQGIAGELSGRAVVGLEQQRLRIARESRTVDVRVQIGFEIVVARHGVLLAALLVQATCPGLRFAGRETPISGAARPARIGQPLSRESLKVLGADVVRITEGDMGGRVIASVCSARRGRRPWHVRKLFVREPGGLGFGLRRDAAGPRREYEES
jgi:hypothetical protein